MTIVIPSAGRSNIVTTKIADAVLYVPESEATAYKKCGYGYEIVTHEDNIYKNLAEKRQGILEKFGDVFMVDDDIAFVSRLYNDGNNRKDHLTPNEIRDLIFTTYENAKSAGCFLFGFNHSPNAKHYRPHKPIRMNSYINACAIGIVAGSGLYFTSNTTAAESHWINLLNIYLNRKQWVDMRFHFAQVPGSTFFRPGGQTDKRTMQSEIRDTVFLRRMFGDAVRLKIPRGDSKLVHEFQRTLDLKI